MCIKSSLLNILFNNLNLIIGINKVNFKEDIRFKDLIYNFKD